MSSTEIYKRLQIATVFDFPRTTYIRQGICEKPILLTRRCQFAGPAY
jgi:hypothetical protein